MDKKGENKAIKVTAARTRVNIFGAIELNSLKLTSETYPSINSESLCNFLEKLKKDYPKKKIHLILDKGSYNTSKKTLGKAKKLKIKIHHLPAYSPNLNPIERVWKVMNEKVRNNVFFESATKFKNALNTFFSSTWDELKHDMYTRINDSFKAINPTVLK